MNYIEQLKSLGFSDKEILLYTKALEIGQFSISSISHETLIKRPTCYLIVDSLVKRGLLTLIPRGRKPLYYAESPEVLIKDAEKRLEITKSILPHLQQIKAKETSIPMIKFFTGTQGVEKVYNDVLKEKPGTILYSISPTSQIVNVVGKGFFENWAKERTKRKIFSKTILLRDKWTKDIVIKTDPTLAREIRYLPHSFYIPTTIGIYGNKVAFFSSKQDNFSFIVKSKEFAETVQVFFDNLWSQSSSESK
jgi:sugar-specific transcriptional regulator TrmB